MRLIRAARFAGVTGLAAGIYMITVLRPYFLLMDDWQQQQTWFGDNMLQWTGGGWVAMVAIFAWMTFLVTLMYFYTPVHRVTTALQSGLVIISAVLFILSIIVFSTMVPAARSAEWRLYADEVSLELLKGGFFMGGGVTAWISIDLALLRKLPWLWMAPGVLAGIVGATSALLFPTPGSALIAMAFFCLWCLTLGLRRTLPDAYPDFG